MQQPTTIETVSISQAAKLSGLSIKTVRYYDTLGLASAQRLASGYRRYAPDDVAKLALIARLRQCHYPLNTIRQVVTEAITGPQSIEHHLDVITQEIQRLTLVQQELIYALNAVTESSETPTRQTLHRVTAVAAQDNGRALQEHLANRLAPIFDSNSEANLQTFWALLPNIAPTHEDKAKLLFDFLGELAAVLSPVTPHVPLLPAETLDNWMRLWWRVDALMNASILPDDEAWNPILDDFIAQGSTLYSLDPDVFRHRWLEVTQYLHKHPEWEDLVKQLFPAWTRQLKRYHILSEALREKTGTGHDPGQGHGQRIRTPVRGYR